MKPRLRQPNALIILLALAVLLSLTNEAGAQQAGVNNKDIAEGDRASGIAAGQYKRCEILL